MLQERKQKKNIMEKSIQVYNSKQFGSVRTVEIDGEPWLVGKDVAVALGYANPQKAIRDHVDDEDKTLNDSFTVNGTPVVLINESGMMSLVLSSKLDSARAFKRWITSEVLPSIRKHGMYATEETLDKMISSPEFGIKLLTALKEEKEKTKSLTAKVEQDAPKVLFADAVATAHTSILIGELAKLLKQNGVDMGQNRLFDWMRKNGYLISRVGTDYNMPTQRSMERGWMEIKENAITRPDGGITVTKTTKITGKGQQYFINLFLKGGNANG